MKKVLKWAGIIIFSSIFLFIVVSYINHKVRLSKEEELIIPKGQMVEVNGHKLHVYTEGKGDNILVFMSGGGTSSPMLDFKSLYSQLSKKYRIVVIEKAGYGFSDVVDIKRDIDSILSETREALSKAKISGPYILCPHSMSGIEAIYWSQKYPKEVNAIVGLDMSVPESYKDFNPNITVAKLGSFAANIGITRWIPSLAQSDAMTYGTLTPKEQRLYKAIFYRRTATKTMLNELEAVKENAKKVSENGEINVPLLLFSSNGEGTGWSKDKWKGFQEDFVKPIKAGRIINLDCSHYVHDIEDERIANETQRFLEGLNFSQYP